MSSKSRTGKELILTVPRQELVACQMGANLAVKVNMALESLSFRKNNCWTDSTVALCWVNEPFESWKTFISKKKSSEFMISPTTST